MLILSCLRNSDNTLKGLPGWRVQWLYLPDSACSVHSHPISATDSSGWHALASRLSNGPCMGLASSTHTPGECPRTQVLSSLCALTGPASALTLQYHIYRVTKPRICAPINNLNEPLFLTVPSFSQLPSGLVPLPGWMASSQSCLTGSVAPARV